MPDNDPDVRFSPAWWFRVMAKRQNDRLTDTHKSIDETVPGLNTLRAWMENVPPLPEGAPEWAPAFQSFHKDTRTNYAEPLVRSATDRMGVLTFRTAAADDDNGDAVAQRVWTENQMMVEQVDLLTDMLAFRDGYTMIVPDPDEGPVPLITAEDPRQVYTVHDPTRRRVVRAAMKRYHDPDHDTDVVWIYLRGAKPADRAMAYRVWKPSSRNQSFGATNGTYRHSAWTWDEPEEMATNRVPIVRFPNRRGKSEFEPHLGILGRLNRIVLQRMLIVEIQSFRQRAVKGLPDVYPENYPVAEMRGKKIDYAGIFTPGPGSMWQVPPDVDFWESQPVDIRPILEEEQHEIRTYAGLAGMPVHYFNPSYTQGSAEGASVQREALEFRIEDRKRIAAVGYAETMAHAFEIMGDSQRANVAAIEPIWAESEKLSLSEKYNAAAQAKGAGMASRTIKREILRWTPTQITVSEADEARDRILQPRPAPTVPVPAPSPNGNGRPFDPQRSQAQPIQPREQR